MNGDTVTVQQDNVASFGLIVVRRFARWSQDRILLHELGARGELDWSRCVIDSVSLGAAKGGH